MMSSLPPLPPQDHPIDSPDEDTLDFSFLFDPQEMDGLGFLDGDQWVGVPDFAALPVQPPPPQPATPPLQCLSNHGGYVHANQEENPPPPTIEYYSSNQEYHNSLDDVAPLNYCRTECYYNAVAQEKDKSLAIVDAAALPVQPPPPPPATPLQCLSNDDEYVHAPLEYSVYVNKEEYYSNQECHNRVDDVVALNHSCTGCYYNAVAEEKDKSLNAVENAMQPLPATDIVEYDQYSNEPSNYVALANMQPDQHMVEQFPDAPMMEYLDNGALLQPSPLLLPLPPAPEHGRRPSSKIRRWSIREHVLFLIGLRDYQHDWIRISNKLLPTRCPGQIASHAQKYFNRQQENNNINAAAAPANANTNTKTRKKRTSIHDITINHLPEYIPLYLN